MVLHEERCIYRQEPQEIERNPYEKYRLEPIFADGNLPTALGTYEGKYGEAIEEAERPKKTSAHVPIEKILVR